MNNIIDSNQNINNKYIKNSNDVSNNFTKNREIASNIVFINKKDFGLWNDLTRIYDNNGKYQ